MFKTRIATINDLSFLKKMLFEASYWRQNISKPDFEQSLQRADLKYLLEDWGRKGDTGIIAEDDNDNPIGAAWYRFWTEEKHSYGYINESIPELTLAVSEEWRGKGVGRELIKRLIVEAKNQNLTKVSLSVEKENFAINLYQKVGFKVYIDNPGDYIMLWEA
jgi:ribosomal protein S18 acetylase RimI-like enzyme